jgi:maltooligosyltrehalose trehalohydrolase
VGNRMLGERLGQLISFEALKLAAGAVLLSPFIPLLFMGEEYGETAPFQYFISHLDPELVEAVRRGRREEFAGFAWDDEPSDPQDEATFRRAKLNHHLRQEGRHGALWAFYQELIRLRKTLPALTCLSKEQMEVCSFEKDTVLSIRRWHDGEEALMVLHFGQAPASIALPTPKGRWRKRLDSADGRWHGPGSSLPSVIDSAGEVSLTLPPESCALFVCEQEGW